MVYVFIYWRTVTKLDQTLRYLRLLTINWQLFRCRKVLRRTKRLTQSFYIYRCNGTIYTWLLRMRMYTELSRWWWRWRKPLTKNQTAPSLREQSSGIIRNRPPKKTNFYYQLTSIIKFYLTNYLKWVFAWDKEERCLGYNCSSRTGWWHFISFVKKLKSREFYVRL